MTSSSSKFGFSTTALEVIEGHNLNGKDVIVTGGAGGRTLEKIIKL